MARRETNYDEEELCNDLACGELTQHAIAAKHRLSDVYVSEIARGLKRPELKVRIDAISEGMLDQARKLGARLAGVAMARLGHLAGKGNAPQETQRKAACDILAHALGDPSKPEIAPSASVKVYTNIDPEKV